MSLQEFYVDADFRRLTVRKITMTSMTYKSTMAYYSPNPNVSILTKALQGTCFVKILANISFIEIEKHT